MAEIALAGATLVLKQAVGVLSSLIIDEGSRLYRLREGILWIESEMRHIQSYLEDADAKQGQNRKITSLVIDIRDLAYDVEDIMETYFPQITSHRRKGIFGRLKSAFCILRNSYTVHNFVVEVEGIKRKVENINRLRLTYGINEGKGKDGRDEWDARRTFGHVDEPYVVGFDKHVKELVTKLHNGDSRFEVISIVGMPGLGKTTLARKILNVVTTPVACDSDNPHFEFSAWVYVSQQPNIKELLLDIARQMHFNILPEKDGKDLRLFKRMREEDIEAKLEDIEMKLFTFLSRKRYVIVIDDIWNTETWVAFKNAIPTNSKNGSRIILTSRNTFVGINVGGRSSLHELKPLDQNTSKELFFKMLTSNTTETLDPPELENIGQQILKRCGGVPLSIVITVGLLLVRDRTEHAWQGVLESMGQDHDQCLDIFALSYKDLPTQLKPCFLYFGLFPEDHEIKVFELINLWVAEGFVKPSGTREVEDMGEDFLNHLIARNLIQVVRRRFDGRIRTCRIHDILHALCIRVSEEINFFKKHDNVTTGNLTTRVRRVTAHRSSLFEYISSNSHVNLRTILYSNGEGETVKIFRDLRFLRVLRLDKIILSRPNDIGNLCHLTYLQLSSVNLGNFPSTLCNLKSLLTLDVQSRLAFDLDIPIGIWNMRQLRHLNLSFFTYAKFRRIDVSLPNLQSLHLGPIFASGDLGVLRLNNLASLRKLAITTLMVSMPLSILNLPQCENLHKLSLGVYMTNFPDLGKLPPNLTKLSLKFTQLVESPLETLKKLPKLKILKLRSLSYKGRQIICSGRPDNFPQLETLEIHDLPRLEELIAEEGAMPRLKKLSIVGCSGLTVISDRFRNITTTTAG
ncbi:Disease resistance RPP8-like protein [Actinidia chinensis var. chinensis]|uniref:Disease resistance RPP8-like protein n=1 Tax=Actinidia chinensis var. chinensis TaxID=1590841 RepID=A0A2R6Q4U4_ACTCC|nr:Disease resistance RPP8-like protein [Actinidia chinensis var. chinensis]